MCRIEARNHSGEFRTQRFETSTVALDDTGEFLHLQAQALADWILHRMQGGCSATIIFPHERQLEIPRGWLVNLPVWGAGAVERTGAKGRVAQQPYPERR